MKFSYDGSIKPMLLLNYLLYPWALWPTASQMVGGAWHPGPPPGSYTYVNDSISWTARSAGQLGRLHLLVRTNSVWRPRSSQSYPVHPILPHTPCSALLAYFNLLSSTVMKQIHSVGVVKHSHSYKSNASCFFSSLLHFFGSFKITSTEQSPTTFVAVVAMNYFYI